jgi:cell division protein FtsB
MNVENENNAAAALAGGADDATVTSGNEDTDLGAIWDQANADEGDTGAARDESGRFAAKDGGDPAAADEGDGGDPNLKDPPQEGEGQGEDDENGSSTLTGSAVPLPANWNGMDEAWKKIPADVQATIAAREQEIHARMSDQGRQISTFKPVHDVFEQNKDLLEGRQTPDGRPVTPAFAAAFLLEAQRRIDANPIGSLIEMAERFGLRDHLRAALNGQLQYQAMQPPAAAGQNSLTAADVAKIVQDTVQQDQSAKAANEEVARLSEGKPFISEIPEEDMVHFIHRARAKLGNTASNEAVFNTAYDMAVHADPTLRAKAAAAAAPANGAAAAQEQKRKDAAKRANSVNVTSTSSGKGRQLTEDELLAAAFDDAHNKD